MDNKTNKMYGLLAKFEGPEALVVASNRIYDEGFRNFDAYTPYPVEGLSHTMHAKDSRLPLIMLAGGITGALTGFFMQYYATVIDYPLNIGGRPLNSWPAYIPITFELTILFTAFAGILGLFFVTRFPQPYHPVFNSEDFNAHASQDGFYLDIQANDPKFDMQQTRGFLESLGALQVSEIEA
jgi:hypothetical protein